MKKLGLLLLSGIILVACNQKGGDDRLKKLENLKKEREELTKEINTLEDELIAEGLLQKDKSVQVKVEAIDSTGFVSYLDLQGKVDGDDNVTATAKTVGVINNVYVKEGQTVYRGQTLAVMDASVLSQSLAELEQQASFLEDIYKRQKALWEQNVGSEIQYLQAKNNFESMQNRISTVKSQIAMNYITSPISGRVEEVNVKVGSSVAPGTPAFRVVNFDKVKVTAEVSETYSKNLKVGSKVLLSFPDLNYETEAPLTFVSKYINPGSRSFRIECVLPSEKGQDYRANMIAVMKINVYSNPEAVSVPQNVVQTSSKGDYLFVAVKKGNKDVAEMRMVKTGEVYNGRTEIVSGLKPGERVVVMGFNTLKDGNELKIVSDN
ncbi:Multidrug resistance protein MdtA [bioreactor metagenome]|uniref:Multidrug resistance protein MdtA n=1 Tax=bioreactor metagenome TaxID=1076179 RepID=A0A644VSC1_9ZZZZ